MKKNILTGLLTFGLCVSMISCGNAGNKTTESGNNSKAEATVSTDEISESNYVSAINSEFGFEPIAEEGWTFKRVERYDDGEVRLVYYTNGKEVDEQAVYKKYFDKAREISDDQKIYRMNNRDGKVYKGQSFTSFDEIKGFPFEGDWLYDFKGKTIEITLVYDENDYDPKKSDYTVRYRLR